MCNFVVSFNTFYIIMAIQFTGIDDSFEDRTDTLVKTYTTTDIGGDILYIGQDDADCELFESQYVTPEGMCYNSFVIMDEKICVMDTSDCRTLEGWKKDLTKVLDGRKPDYLVVHHVEPDHASGIGEMLDMYPELKVVCSAKAAQMLPLYFGNNMEGRVMTVKEGDILRLGKHDLRFIMAPMVHWPEVMMTYDEKAKVLFSADAFGKFGVIGADPDDWTCEARRYYFNICGKYGVMVQNVLKKISDMEISKIMPLHGPLLKGDKMAEAMKLYRTWSAYEVETEGVFVAYASIHGCTKQAAERMAEILKEEGCQKVAISDLAREDQAEAIEDAFRYGKIVLAASSYDAGVFPPMHDFIVHLQSKGYQKRKVALVENGSWAPSAGRVMRQMMEQMKGIDIVPEMVTIRGRMTKDDEDNLRALAKALLEQ